MNARWPEPTAPYNSTKGKIFNFIKYCKHHFIVMYDKMTGHRKEQKMKQKKKNAKGDNAEEAKEVEKKTFESCIIFYANSYPEEQQAAIKVLQEIGYDDDYAPKDSPITYLKAKFTDKKELGKAMKFAATLNDEIRENRSLDFLDLETTYNVKEIIEQHSKFIFGELKIQNIDFKEKNEKCDIEGCQNSISAAVPGKPSIFFY